MFLDLYLYRVEEVISMLPDLVMAKIFGFLGKASFQDLVCASFVEKEFSSRSCAELRIGFSDYLNNRSAAALDIQRVYRGWIHGRILFQRSVDTTSNIVCQYSEEDYGMPGGPSYSVKWSMNFCEDECICDY